MNRSVRLFWFGVVVGFLWSAPGAGAAETVDGTEVTTVTEHTYTGGKTDTEEVARALALFGARRKAVKLAAKYLTHKGLLEHHETRQNEIFCLAADEIEADLLDASYDPAKHTYFVKIRSTAGIGHFIRAQIRDLEFEREEAAFSYSEEMGQPVMEGVAPGQEISRAYRYIRKKQWRIAIIYLDHLEKKYPYWGDAYLAKAIAFYGMNAREKMIAALTAACHFKNAEACEELSSFATDEP